MALLTNWLNADLFSVLRDKVNAIVTAVNPFGGGTVDQIAVKNGSSDFDVTYKNSILPDTGVANLKIKVLNIGDWNMDTTAQVLVAHGVNHKKIKSVSVVVRSDDDALYSISPFLDPADLLSHALVTTNIQIDRVNGSFFDSVNYDSTSFNRGFITIIYEG